LIEGVVAGAVVYEDDFESAVKAKADGVDAPAGLSQHIAFVVTRQKKAKLKRDI
jgi:hypothetical protein